MQGLSSYGILDRRHDQAWLDRPVPEKMTDRATADMDLQHLGTPRPRGLRSVYLDLILSAAGFAVKTT